LLNRFFVGSVAAGRKAIYTLSKSGNRVAGIERPPVSRSHGKTLVGDLYVDHQMHINEIYCSVKFRPLPIGARFVGWRSFHEPLSEHSRLIPDGYFELQSPAGTPPSFLEIDLGHQSMKIWEQKVRRYLQLAISGDFNRLFRKPQFRVLVITTSQRRLMKIRSVISKQTDKVFWLSDFKTINRAGLWSACWLRASGDQPLALI
jgi:hypothetical protein